MSETWTVTMYYYDLAATDDDGFRMRDEDVAAPDEATAVELAESQLRLEVPSAHILIERTEAFVVPTAGSQET
jgi:hypothetical protein